MHTEKPTINKNQQIYYHQIASISTGEDSKYWYIKVTGKCTYFLKYWKLKNFSSH